MKLSDLKIDAKRRQEGDWVPLAGLSAEVKVRGARNYDWQRVQADVSRQIAIRDSVRGGLEPEQQREVLIECILQAGLLDWRGELFTDDDGKPIAHSPEKAAEVYKDPGFEMLVDVTNAACEAMAYAAIKGDEDDAKN